MFLSLFHVLYLLGKHFYVNCFTTKPKTYCVPRHVQDCNMKFSPPAYVQRYLAVVRVLEDPKYSGKIRKIVDFGCAEMGLLPYLKKLPGLKEILLVDVDRNLLYRNKRKAMPLSAEYLNKRKSPLKVEICVGNVIANDVKLMQTDAVTCIELIEHLEPVALEKLPRNIFGNVRPKVVIITTPNSDFNVVFSLKKGEVRHPDHKFEWTRSEFKNWCRNIIWTYTCYRVRFEDVCFGPEGTESLGACTQMAIFERKCETYYNPSEHYFKANLGLLETLEVYEYPYCEDHRSNDDKILDEILYYSHYITMYQRYPSYYEYEIDLNKLQSMMTYHHVTIEELKQTLISNGYTIKNQESGPAFVFPLRCLNQPTSDDFENTFECGESTDLNKVATLNEDEIGQPEDWEGESSIVIPQNVSINQENSYLFDGTEETTDNYNQPGQPAVIHNGTNLSKINGFDDSSVNIEQGSSESKTPSTSSVINKNSTSKRFQTNQLYNLMFKHNLDATKGTANVANDVTVDVTQPGPSGSDVKHFKRKTLTISSPLLNFEYKPPVSCPVTSLYHSNVESNNFSTSQHFNDNGHTAKIAKNATEQKSNRDEMNSSECMYKGNSEICYSDTLKQNGVSQMENQIMKIEMQTQDINPNQSRLTSSPKCCKNMTTTNINESCTASSDSMVMLADYIELSPIKGLQNNFYSPYIKWVEDISKEYSVINNTATKIGRRTMHVSLDKNDISRPDVNCTNSNNTEYSVSNCFDSSFSRLPQENDMKEENDVTNCKIDENIIDIKELCVQHISPSDNEYEKHTDRTPEIAESMGTDEANAETCSKSVNECLPHLDPDGEAFNLPTDSLNLKSFNECSKHSECANESDTSRDIYESFDDSGKQAAFSSPASTSKINDIVRSDVTDIMAEDLNMSSIGAAIANVKTKPSSPGFETPLDSLSHEIVDSGYPNSASGQDITPENDLSSIAQDHIPDIESPSIAEVPRLDIPEPMEVENGDLANNNRDDEGNNMVAVDVNNDIEGLQPFFDVLENDIENENDIYVLENGFPIWLLRILNMPNPFDMQLPQNLRDPDQAADNVNYADPDEGFDSDE